MCAWGGGRGPAPGHVALTCEDGIGPSSYSFRSSFWLNLHNFLYREARGVDVRRGAVAGDPDPFGNFAIELERVRAPSPDERAAWGRAIEYYRPVVVPDGLRDSVVVRVNNVLGSTPAATPVERLPVDAAWADALRAAAPVHAALWWPEHDARNRAWITAVRPLLDAHMPCLAPTMARLLGGPWPAAPVTVDVSVYASWFGAYATLEPEALSHMLLFYTAGELVRARIPTHVPFGERFHTYDRTRARRLLFARLEAEWRPVLEGPRPGAAGVAALAAR